MAMQPFSPLDEFILLHIMLCLRKPLTILNPIQMHGLSWLNYVHMNSDLVAKIMRQWFPSHYIDVFYLQL